MMEKAGWRRINKRRSKPLNDDFLYVAHWGVFKRAKPQKEQQFVRHWGKYNAVRMKKEEENTARS